MNALSLLGAAHLARRRKRRPLKGLLPTRRRSRLGATRVVHRCAVRRGPKREPCNARVPFDTRVCARCQRELALALGVPS
jgi:hypothetical protein